MEISCLEYKPGKRCLIVIYKNNYFHYLVTTAVSTSMDGPSFCISNAEENPGLTQILHYYNIYRATRKVFSFCGSSNEFSYVQEICDKVIHSATSAFLLCCFQSLNLQLCGYCANSPFKVLESA